MTKRLASTMLRPLAWLAIAAVTGIGGCSAWFSRSEGLDPSTLPDDLRDDYALFSVRCSKCHSLARPLSSGIDDDDYWAMYVARMRRQPGSGISQEDTVKILRFLHYYSLEQRRKKAKSEPPPPAPAPAPAPAPTPAPAPSPPSSPSPAPAPPDAGLSGNG